MKRRFALAAVVGAVLATVGAATVLGHAQLVSSDPASGATIKTPYHLTATFDDELTPNGSSIVVQAANGTTVASGTVSDTDDHTMTADLPVLPDGQYTVKWTAVSSDDNAVERGLYEIETSSAASAPTPAASSAAATPTGSSTPAGTSAPAVSPAPSAAPGQSIGSGTDLLIPLAIVVVFVVAIAGYFIYRNRS